MCECGAAGSATRCSACPVLCHSESGPLGLSVSECGAEGSAIGQTACPAPPTLRQSQSGHSHGSPLCPGARLRPSYRSGSMFWTSLPFNFLSVLVVRVGSVCLPTPPSWFSSSDFSLSYSTTLLFYFSQAILYWRQHCMYLILYIFNLNGIMKRIIDEEPKGS